MSTPATLTDSARATPNLWRFANIEFDERSFELRLGGVSVDVERAPLRVLRELLETPRELVSRERLLASVWKRKPETISRNALTNAVGKLRRAIGDEGQTLIASSSGEGYRLVAEVERRALPPLQSLNQILKGGEPAPLRPNWMMRERIGTTDSSEVWIVEQPKTHERRVFKFASDGFQLAALRREITISRLLREALGVRPEFVRIHDWNLEQPPYFIESDHGGADLVQWAARHEGLDRLPLAERIRVIAELADAVALAHSVGALHKDLKPGNVLIDDTGRVRVVDFGSGRLLEPELLDQFHITRITLPDADPNSGTPFYIAPELLSGQSATVASDVYSIGVLLYQFIVGDLQRPIAPGWEGEIEDPLLREDIALAASGNPARRPTASDLAIRLRTLDARRRQYDAAIAEQSRAADLQRKLAFAEQRRRGLRWAVLALAAGLVATSGVSLKLLQTQHQREAALRQADEESANAREISRYVSSLFEAANPEKNGGKPIEPRQLVDLGRTQIDRESGQPLAVRVRLMTTLADLYCKLGEAEACRQQIESALKVQGADAAVDPDVAAALLELKSRADDLEFRNDDAERNLREALALLDRRPASDPQLRAQILQELGTALMWRSKNEEALAVLNRSRELYRGPDGADTLASIKTLMSLSQITLDLGHGDEALSLAGQVVEMAAAKAGKTDLVYFDAETNQARILMGKQRYDGAENLLRSALTGYRQIYGPAGRRVFDTENTLVDLLDRKGSLHEASTLASQLVVRMRPLAGPDDPGFAVALNDAGNMLQRYGSYEDALSRLREAYEINRRHFGDGDMSAVRTRCNLGTVLLFSGRADQALDLLKTEIPADLQGTTIDYWRVRRLVYLGRTLSALGRFAEAEAMFDQAEALRNRITDSGFDLFTLVNGAHGRALVVQGRYAEARTLLQRTLDMQKEANPVGDPWVLETRSYIALCDAHLGERADSERIVAEILPLIRNNLAPTHLSAEILRETQAQLRSSPRPVVAAAGTAGKI